MSFVRKIAFKCCLAACFTLISAPLAVAQERRALPAQSIDLYGGQVQVYRLDRNLARVAVGNGDLIEVTTVDKNQIVLIAGTSTSGVTTLHLWYEDGSQRTLSVRVSGALRPDAASAIAEMLGPDTKVRLNEIGGNLVLSGELGSHEVQRIDVIKQVYGNIIDLTSADPVDMKPMVLMDVRVMEFNRNALRDLGVRWDPIINGPDGGYIKDFTNSGYRILPDGSPFEDLVGDLPSRINPGQGYFGIATTIGSQIDILETSGMAWELASPQLSARSGSEAKFLAGGRIPIPVQSGFGQTTVQYEDYGIQLEITPHVNGNNEIMAMIRTEVSKLDPTVTVLGVPGFLTRETETEFNVSAGETIVLSGLVDITASEIMEGLPGLSRIPILGKLFGSESYRAGRTDLVIFVTPRVVTPGSPRNIQDIERSDRMLENFRNTIGGSIFD
ncbi:MAG: type II and III secretion system protein family protein [Luteimonas sp.]